MTILGKIFVVAVLLVCWNPLTGFAETSPLRRTPVVLAVEKVSPAVVNISTEQIVQVKSPFGADPFFDQFFRDFVEPFPGRQYKQNSLGSGVIIDAQGYVLTNQHVILKASKITVTLADNREFEGKVVGADAQSDLAIVKVVTEERLPAATMGTSGDLLIGEPVIAIGNPFGLSHTVTTGVVSALNRTIRVSDDLVLRGFIQIDAPINPGNSGGPLVNILGEVIGINTAIYSEAQGIGFAIPIDRAKRISRDLMATGEVRTAWIGIALQELTPALARHFRMPSTPLQPPASGENEGGGVLIAQVREKSSAARAGLQQGDILVALDQHPVRDRQGYEALLNDYAPGDAILFALVRNGKPLELKVVAEEFSTEQAVTFAYQEFGLYIEELTPRLTAQYDLQATEGVVVTKVQKNSAAANVGVEPGDLIRQIDARPIAKLADLRQALAAAQEKSSVVFLVQRGNRGYYVTLEH